MSEWHQHWVHVLPANAKLGIQTQDGETIIFCEAPEEPPPPPPPPDTYGQETGTYKIAWECKAGVVDVTSVVLTEDG